MRVHRTTWFVTPTVTWAGTDYAGETPAPAVASMGALLTRVADQLKRQGATEGVILLDPATALSTGLSEPPTNDGRNQRALDAATAAGWLFGEIGPWTTFRQRSRPTIYVGQLDRLTPDAFPLRAQWPGDTCSSVQHWHRLTGVAWQAGPAVMGLELMHRTLKPYRVENSGTGRWEQRKPDLRDDHTPHDAAEGVWSPDTWSRAELAPYAHGYDKRRAGPTAAGLAKLSPSKLMRWRGQYDPKRAGWWLVEVPPWNVDTMPHPLGPGAAEISRRQGGQNRMWVTTPTMDLAAELAGLGLLSMPEVIDSLTGPARAVLADWQQTIETAYRAACVEPDWEEPHDRERVQTALKESATRGIGMLAKADGRSSIWRPDWNAAITAAKRANGWRAAYKVGTGPEHRWPIAFDDDCVWYSSDDADPYKSAPAGLPVTGDDPGADTAGTYRVQATKELATRRSGRRGRRVKA